MPLERTVPSVIVIGGGFAGLRAAVDLADAGIAVTLLESKNALGGRARSFRDPATGEVVDNGQHLFLAGYTETMRFLTRLGTAQHLVFQEELRVAFAEARGKQRVLNCPRLSEPWHLVMGLIRFSGLSFLDKLNLWRVAWEVEHAPETRARETVEKWLTRMGQGRAARKHFWYPLAIATLNEDPARASAMGLLSVMRGMMGKPWPHARLGMPSVGLSDLYVDAARKIIEEHGGEVRLNCTVTGITLKDWMVSRVYLADGSSERSDAIISAVPPGVLHKIFPTVSLGGPTGPAVLEQYRTSPILSVNLWLDRFVTGERFVGLVGTRFHWLFNKPALFAPAGITTKYLSLVMSAAHDYIDQSNEDLVAAALEDLKRCFPDAEGVKVIRSQVVRERDATVSLTPELDRARPGVISRVENFFLAGDWVATGLPATIESAVVSGGWSAREVLKWLASTSSARYNMPVGHEA